MLLHGRSQAKLDAAASAVAAGGAEPTGYIADLSDAPTVAALAQAVRQDHGQLDVLINNAGIFRTAHPIAANGLDVRFAVNTIAPYVLTRALLDVMPAAGRVVNLSSAAQAPVNLDALRGNVRLSDEFEAYAQSKLALTMWSQALGAELGAAGPVVVAVNPGSLLASKMVKEGFGVAGKDLGVGVDILSRASLASEFASATGRYFDNDSGRFADPHRDVFDASTVRAVVTTIGDVSQSLLAAKS